MWTIADAEGKLDRIFTLAVPNWPQRINDGGRTVVMIPRAEDEHLTAPQDAVRTSDD